MREELYHLATNRDDYGTNMLKSRIDNSEECSVAMVTMLLTVFDTVPLESCKRSPPPLQKKG